MKEKVQETNGDAFPAANQVLIFQGKVGQPTDPEPNATMQLQLSRIQLQIVLCDRC